VNGVIVGPTATPDAPDSPEREGAKAMTTAEKRLGTMDDVAEVVAFLASEGSRWVNGDHIGANGGIYIQS
jgi:3-oxoacyl-[acyl-carrier protein] reductase